MMGGKLFHLRRKKVHCPDEDGDDDDSGAFEEKIV